MGHAKESAFGAAGLFIVSFFASICCLFVDARRNPPEIVHAVDDDLHPPVPYYEGESEYIRSASISTRSAVESWQREKQQTSGQLLIEMRKRPSSSGILERAEFS